MHFHTATTFLTLSVVVSAAPVTYGPEVKSPDCRGLCGGPGNFQNHAPPFFLQNVTEQGRDEFFSIFSNSSLTISEIETKTENWAEDYNVTTQYDAFAANETAQMDRLQQNVTSIASNLSSVQSTLLNIINNKNQTQMARGNSIDALRQQYPIEVDTLFYISHQIFPRQPEPEGPDSSTYPAANA